MNKIELPGEIIIGENILKDISKICKEMRLSGKCLVLEAPNIMKHIEQDIKENLIKNFTTKERIVDSIDKREVDIIVEESKNYDFIIGIGGGKVIDIAKYVAYSLDKPFISIPTAPSHDGITSPRASLTYNGKKFSYQAKVPTAIIIDIDILSKSPYRMIASGCADMIAKITAIADWKLANEKKGEDFSEYAAALSLLSAQIVLRSADKIKARDKEGIKNLMEALINSGIAMCIAGSSRPASGSEHLISHALDMNCPNKTSMHGEQCGVGTIISAYLHDLPWKEIRETLKNLGCPVDAKGLGVSNNDMIKAICTARLIRSDRYTILDTIDIDEKMAEKIAKITGVIQ